MVGVSRNQRWLILLLAMFTSFGVNRHRGGAISPIPLKVEEDSAKVKLGKLLFNDKRLSLDGNVSCASCHNLATGGTDLLPVSVGNGAQEGAVNSPTVFNVRYNFRQFWDGRAETLEDQIDGPINNALEMGLGWEKVLQIIGSDKLYREGFAKAYPGGISQDNVKNAIATFERTLITPNSRFDQYLRGNDGVLTEKELRGYGFFKDYGCVTCHQGTNLGGNMFQVFGVLNNYFEHRGNGIQEADLGRYNVTGQEADKHVFKVPSLRMAAVTPPYFHDGSVQTLREAVDVMFEFQLGRDAPDEHKDAIVAFLRTLIGYYQEQP